MTGPSATALPAAITAIGLSKSYGDKVVLDGIDLRIPDCTVLALLRPNGAGKPTTVQILSTLIPANAGEAHVAGHDPDRDADPVRAATSVTGQFSVGPHLPGRQDRSGGQDP